jgi:hypothetical protein
MWTLLESKTVLEGYSSWSVGVSAGFIPKSRHYLPTRTKILVFAEEASRWSFQGTYPPEPLLLTHKSFWMSTLGCSQQLGFTPRKTVGTSRISELISRGDPPSRAFVGRSSMVDC